MAPSSASPADRRSLPAAAQGRAQIIAVPLKEFAEWGGGIDFIRLILEGLLRDPRLRIVALIPRPPLIKRVRRLGDAVLASLKGLVRGRAVWNPRPFADPDAIQAAIQDFVPRIEIRFYSDHRRVLNTVIQDLGADAIIPCIRPMPSYCRTPWVGYIFDFQHRHLPHLFTEAERHGRDLSIGRMLEAASVVICNSESALEDVERFHPGSAGKIVALPWTSVPRAHWFELDAAQARERYHLPERYFLVSNQFWVHKDHPTAIRAFAAYLARGGNPGAALVCTGKIHDYRNPAHGDTIRSLISVLGLDGRVHLLGHIPKDDQIALLRGAVAVVQPTWFEGGRGGGAVLDAVGLGIPVLMSDIPVNLEIEADGCRFFKKGDPDALAALMLEQDAAEPVRLGKEELLRRSEAEAMNLSRTLADVIRVAQERATAAPDY